MSLYNLCGLFFVINEMQVDERERMSSEADEGSI